MKRRRLLRLGKWTGLVLCVLVAGVWVASARWTLRWRLCPDPHTLVSVRAAGGRLFLRHATTTGAFEKRPPWYGDADVRRPAEWEEGARWEWWFDARSDETPWMSRGSVKTVVTTHDLYIPFWAPFLLLAVPTGFLWWRDRRVRPGFCRCGYDLKGLQGRPCPECGRGGATAGPHRYDAP